MPRPLPIIPRGPRRRRAANDRLLFACPRVAPDWELAALRALMKPQTRGTIAHRRADQPWSRDAMRVLEACSADVTQHLGFSPEIHFPAEGDYFFACDVDEADFEKAKGFALLASTRLPELWFVLGRLYVKGGRFHRRRLGWKLQITRATNVHLARPIRVSLRDLL